MLIGYCCNRNTPIFSETGNIMNHGVPKVNNQTFFDTISDCGKRGTIEREVGWACSTYYTQSLIVFPATDRRR